MRLFYCILFCLLHFNCACAERLRPEHDIEYLGAFRAPTDTSSSYSLSWTTQFALTYNPNNNTLISPSPQIGSNFGKVVEFSIPTPVNTKTLSSMNVASTVHDWTDLTVGKWNIGLSEASLAGMAYMPAQGTQSKSKLYWLTTSWYGDPNPYSNTAVPTLGMSDLDFTSPSAKGTWVISDVDHGPVSFTRTSLFLGNIPDSWSSTHAPGYKLFSGQHKINNGGALGTCLYAIKPWQTDSTPAQGTSIDAKVLVCPGGDEDTAHRRNYDHSLYDNYSWQDSSNDAAWVSVGSRSAVLISGSVATLTAPGYGDCNSATDNCQYYKSTLPGDADQVISPTLGCSGGICDTSPDAPQGLGDVRGEPYYRVLWVYDPDDLAAVVAGTKQQYEPQPYVIFNLEKYMIYDGTAKPPHSGGIAYDSVHQKIYVAELQADTTLSSYDPAPIIHVFQLHDSGLAADTTAPSPVTVTHNGSGTLTWPESTDNVGIGGYMVYRNGKPIAFTTKNMWVDTVYNRFIGYPNHTYTVDPVDLVNNSVLRGGTPTPPPASSSFRPWAIGGRVIAPSGRPITQ